MKVEILTKEQIVKIHQASLTILEKVGVIVPHDKILQRFINSGASVDQKKSLVRIPPHLVLELLSKADKSFTIYGRDLNKKAEFGFGKRNYNTSGGQALWLDKIGGKRRYANFNDVTTAVRFADALDQITISGAMADPHELPIEWRCVKVAYEMIKSTTKPITFWFYDKASTKYLVNLIISLRGDEKKAQNYPMFYPLFEPVSPLSFPNNGIDLLFETAKVNMPVQIGPMAQMGMTAPVTLAGTMAQENAEILAGICITQLIREGIPICYGGICHAFDMKTMQIIFSGPEQAIFSIAMSQMGKYYGFPVYVNAGLTDSKSMDAQAGLESGLTLALGAAAGADIFGHMGICGADQAASLDILIMQSEIISYIESTNRQIKIEDDDIALHIIEQAGPKGTFIDKKHTFKHFKNELWFPNLLDRDSYDSWVKKGSTTLETRCRKRKEELQLTASPEPLDKDIVSDLEKIVDNAKQSLLSSN